MLKHLCKILSPEIEHNVPYNQNLYCFPSFALCSANTLWKFIVIDITQALICFTLSYLKFLRRMIALCSLSLSGPIGHCTVLTAERTFKKICFYQSYIRTNLFYESIF